MNVYAFSAATLKERLLRDCHASAHLWTTHSALFRINALKKGLDEKEQVRL